ncbi:MAG TPA: endonuclease domain-containing protein [Bacteroidia bacterium]|nr:endonuclease domain-containing protein [Bacteroidia bacterium]
MNKSLITKRCRRLRKNSTPAEQLLWQRLRGRKINGLKFLRQYPFIYQSINYKLYYFIADFYCAEKKLVIELDGKIHEQTKEYDENRDFILNEMKLTVVRFKNEEIEKVISFVKSL